MDPQILMRLFAFLLRANAPGKGINWYILPQIGVNCSAARILKFLWSNQSRRRKTIRTSCYPHKIGLVSHSARRGWMYTFRLSHDVLVDGLNSVVLSKNLYVCCVLFWRHPRIRTKENSCCVATYFPSHKPLKLNKRYMLFTAECAGTNT